MMPDAQRGPWVPPPALTTAAGVVKRGIRRRHRKCESRSADRAAPCRCARTNKSAGPQPRSRYDKAAGDDDALFQAKLEHLLSDIRHLKSGLVDPQSDDDKNKQEAYVPETTVPSDGDGRGDCPAIQQLPERGNGDPDQTQPESKGAYGQELIRQHGNLLAKLSRIEGNANEAIQHVVSLRSTVDKFNEGSVGRGESKTDVHSRQMLDRLRHLDVANRSLQKLLNDARDGDIVYATPKVISRDQLDSTTNSQVLQITEQVQNLQGRLMDDRKMINELQAVLRQMKSTSRTEKEEAKKSIKLHKDRADRYLASIESLNVRTSQKNKEMVALKQEVCSLRLEVSRLNCERERLSIESKTLATKLNVVDSGQRGQELESNSRLEEISSKYLEASTKIASLEIENERLKMSISTLKSEATQLMKEAGDAKHSDTVEAIPEIPKPHTRNKKANKSTQINFDRHAADNADKLVDKIPADVNMSQMSSPFPVGGRESEQWLKIFDMWRTLQNDKLDISQSLKDLEKKLETSQQANVAFRTEINKKERTLQEISTRLQEKIEENKSLQNLLEAALCDTRRYGDLVKEKSLSMDMVTQTRIKELENNLLECQRDNGNLKRDKNDMERKLNSRITELQQRLELADKSKRAMNDYIAFLKSSYANVFGDGFIAK